MRRAVVCLVFSLLAAVAAAQAPEPDRRLAESLYKKGVSLMWVESWEEAAEEFKAAMELDPLMAMAHYNLGQCRMNQKRFIEAVAAYKRCQEAFDSLSTLSQKDRDVRERARRDEIQDLKSDLTRLSILKNSNLEQRTVRIEERIRFLESLQFKDGGHIQAPGEVFLALGSAYFRQSRLEDAEREYAEAVRLKPQLGPAHNNMAVIYLMTGRLGEAEAALKRAEKNGFRVNPRLKEDVKKARAGEP